MEEIPQELILNWDQTAIHYFPVSSWTMASRMGSNHLSSTLMKLLGMHIVYITVANSIFRTALEKVNNDNKLCS